MPRLLPEKVSALPSDTQFIFCRCSPPVWRTNRSQKCPQSWSLEFQRGTGLISFYILSSSVLNNVQIRLTLFHNKCGLVIRHEKTPRRCVFFPHCRVRRGWRWVFQLRGQRRQHQQRSNYYQPRQLNGSRGRDCRDNR